MATFGTADIQQHKPDSAGVTVRIVYVKNPPYYTVYGTDERVVIQFADDPLAAQAQRAAIVRLNPPRSEINGLVDGWRSSKNSRLKAKAKCYDRRLADALALGLEGDVDSAFGALQEVARAIVEDRTSWARFFYLIVASGTAVALIAIIAAATSEWFARNFARLPSDTSSLWLAGATGAVGAFFSIAIGIRSRTVLTDLNMRDNVADSLLRVLIGVIAATLLQCLLLSKAVHLAIGGVDLAPATGGSPWTVVLIVGFVAGFSERLIPDLLARTTLDPAKTTVPTPAPGAAAPAAPPKLAFVAPPGAAPPAPAHDPDCLCDLTLTASDFTPDDALPAAKGGVAPTPAAVG